MARKIYDLCAVVEKFKASDGTEKVRHQHIGVELENEEGYHFLILNPWINLAGLKRDPQHNGILISKFSPSKNGNSKKEES